MITAESKAKLFEKTYDAYLLAQSVTRVYGVQAGRLIRHFLNTFEPDITVKRFRKRYKELQKDLREDVPHKVLYSSRGTRYYWLQENVLSFLRNRINIKAEVK